MLQQVINSFFFIPNRKSCQNGCIVSSDTDPGYVVVLDLVGRHAVDETFEHADLESSVNAAAS